jgi:hypothetical protein
LRASSAALHIDGGTTKAVLSYIELKVDLIISERVSQRQNNRACPLERYSGSTEPRETAKKGGFPTLSIFVAIERVLVITVLEKRGGAV